jgi:hypothetical protein
MPEGTTPPPDPGKSTAGERPAFIADFVWPVLREAGVKQDQVGPMNLFTSSLTNS